MLGTITTTLRPLKFAFLVHPRDRSGLREAIELNTVLWGGQFNPIIPTYQRLPADWRRTGRSTTAREVFTGYIEAFDPDYVVPIGKIAEPPFPVCHRMVLSRKAVLGKFEETGTLGYGIGIFDILRHFVQEELRFKRRVPLRVVLPEPYRRYSLFLASTLGTLPGGTELALREYWTEPLSASWQQCEGHSYAELLDKNTLFPRRLSCLFLGGANNPNRGQRDCVFIMDATSTVDIIDFWNLRAIGWNVIPAPVQFTKHDDVSDLANKFIDDNYFTTTILNSENVKKEHVDKFVESLNIKPKEGTESSKIILQHSYPRIWDSRVRHRDQLGDFQIETDTRSLDIPEDRRRLHMKTLDPKFMSRFGNSTKASFANMIDMKFYGASPDIAQKRRQGPCNTI